MERITFLDTAKELTARLEWLLAKMAMAADARIGTADLETEAQKLARKLKESAQLFTDIPMYKDVKITDQVYAFYITKELPDDIFSKYAGLCKRFKDPTLEVYKDSGLYFAMIDKNVFVCISELPEVSIPKFKIRIEGDQLMAVNAELFVKLPEKAQGFLKLEGVKDGDIKQSGAAEEAELVAANSSSISTSHERSEDADAAEGG